jgi:hypothetical protein
MRRNVEEIQKLLDIYKFHNRCNSYKNTEQSSDRIKKKRGGG